MGCSPPSFLLSRLALLLSWEFYSIFMFLHIEVGVVAGGAAPCLSNQSLALLQFKKSLSHDSHKLLSTWQHGSNCCRWKGISCDHTTGFVTGLDLYNFSVQASELVPSLFELRRLQSLNLGRNSFDGMIPSTLSELKDLQDLCLSACNFNGPIPDSIVQLSNLTRLDLSGNSLSGEIPPGLLNHPHLRYLNLSSNNLTGPLLAVGSGLSALRELDLSYNMLVGKIPSSITNLRHLAILDLAGNRLNGTVHLSIFQNLTNLSSLILSDNELTVDEAANFSCMQKLELRSCNIKGDFPWFLKSARCLTVLDLSHNSISGKVPAWVWELSRLQRLRMSNNMLNGFEEAVNLTGSMHIGVDSSSKYKLPSKRPLKKISSIQHLDMSDNFIRGAIPSTVFCNMFDMQFLYLSRNYLTGVIPDCMTNLTKLSILNLRENQLHGEIPRGIVCGRHISGAVELRSNRLTGEIARFLYNCSSDLLALDMSGNRLTGSFPDNWFTGFDQLQELDLSNNQLHGPIPGDLNISCATSLRLLNLGENQFTGGIPEEIGELKGLYLLNLSSNSLDGLIPRSLGNLENIEALDLSHNHLSGSIPEELTNDTFLSVLDLSHNNLQGRIPQGKQFNTFDATSFDGNPGLCGPPLRISCPSNGPPPVISQSSDGNGSQDSVNGIKEKTQNSYWEYAAVEFGFVLGILTIILPILFIERLRSWYKDCVDKALETCIL